MQSITSILHQAVKDSEMGVKEIAARIDKPYHALMSELSGQERHKFGADYILPIMKLTKNCSFVCSAIRTGYNAIFFKKLLSRGEVQNIMVQNITVEN